MRGWLKAILFTLGYLVAYLIINLLSAWGDYIGASWEEKQLGRTSIFLVGILLLVQVARKKDKISFNWRIKEVGILSLLISLSSILLIYKVINFLESGALLSFLALVDWKSLIVTIVITCTLGFCEEFFFRGILLQGILKYLSSFYACFLSSVLFTLFHTLDFHFDLSTLQHFLFGFLMGLLVLKYNAIGYSVAFHVLWNFIISLLHVCFERFNSEDVIAPNLDTIVVLILLFAAIIFILIKDKPLKKEMKFYAKEHGS